MAKQATDVTAPASNQNARPLHVKKQRQSNGSAERQTGRHKAPPPAKASASPAPRTTLSGLDAAHAVLTTAGEPMNVQGITKAIFAQKLWTTSGKTPHATIAAAIMREMARSGTTSRFVKAGRGLFAARSTTPASASRSNAAKAASRTQSSKRPVARNALSPAECAGASPSPASPGNEPSAKRAPAKTVARPAVASEPDHKAK